MSNLIEIALEYHIPECAEHTLNKVNATPHCRVEARIPYVTFVNGVAQCDHHIHRLTDFHIVDGRLFASTNIPFNNYKIPYAKVMVVQTAKHPSWI